MNDQYFESHWTQYIDHRELEKKMEQKMSKEDPVNKPSHYNQGKFEVIEIIEDQKLDYHLGNVLKYVLRSRYKGKELEDLKKARWYLDRKIEKIEKQNEPPF
jgi:hypothetical protein